LFFFDAAMLSASPQLAYCIQGHVGQCIDMSSHGINKFVLQNAPTRLHEAFLYPTGQVEYETQAKGTVTTEPR
jgi:hypothetical protein